MDQDVDSNSTHRTEGGQKPKRIRGREPKISSNFYLLFQILKINVSIPEYVFPLADDNKGLLATIVGIDVFQRRGHQLLRELGGQADGEWHPALQDGICNGAIVVVVIVISNLK